MNFVLLTPERLGPSVPRVHFSQDKGNQCHQGEGQDFFLFFCFFLARYSVALLFLLFGLFAKLLITYRDLQTMGVVDSKSTREQKGA